MFVELLTLKNGSFFAPVVGNSVFVQSSFLFYVIAFLGLIFAITVHEFAHAWSAHLLGDDTAKYNDRMNINPFKHFDMFGFLLILFTRFGYGKPVPVNPNNFKNPLFGNMVVSLAGPVSNLLQASIYALLFLALKRLPVSENFLTTLIYTLPTIGVINVALAVFNLLPVYPLDGSKIWGYFSTTIDDFIQQIAPYSIFILLFLIFPVLGSQSILSMILTPFIQAYSILLRL
jgi:Zn-dependent protease